jgi:uncharacterized membrane protein YdfJ with MMPL/SSD domain
MSLRHSRTNRARTAVFAATAALLLIASAAPTGADDVPAIEPTAPEQTAAEIAATATGGGRPEPAEISSQDAEMQAATLAAEDRRLIEIRTVTSLARWQGQNWKTPYRLGTPSGYTLVLTPRSEAYTVDDLQEPSCACPTAVTC